MYRMKDKKDGEEEVGRGAERREGGGGRGAKGKRKEKMMKKVGAALCGQALAGYHMYTLLFPASLLGGAILFHFTEESEGREAK